MAVEIRNEDEIIVSQDVIREQPPCDRHPAICIDVIPVGVEEGEFYDKKTGKTIATKSEKVWLVFQLFPEDGSRDSEGKPFIAENKFTASLSPQAILRLKLERWRGRDFTKEELDGFNLAKLKGVPCWISLIPNGNFVNVSDIEPYLDDVGKPLTPPTAEPENYKRRTYKKPQPKVTTTTTPNSPGGSSNGAQDKSNWVPF